MPRFQNKGWINTTLQWYIVYPPWILTQVSTEIVCWLSVTISQDGCQDICYPITCTYCTLIKIGIILQGIAHLFSVSVFWFLNMVLIYKGKCFINNMYGAHSVTVIIEGNEHSNPCSNLGWGCLHFT